MIEKHQKHAVLMVLGCHFQLSVKVCSC